MILDLDAREEPHLLRLGRFLSSSLPLRQRIITRVLRDPEGFLNDAAGPAISQGQCPYGEGSAQTATYPSRTHFQEHESRELLVGVTPTLPRPGGKSRYLPCLLETE